MSDIETKISKSRDTPEEWMKITEQASSSEKHPSPDVDIFLENLENINPTPGDKILDIGIGFGRFIPCYIRKELDVYGIDISEEMINTAKSNFPKISQKLNLSSSESLVFPDKYFDVVVCWAAFEELDQEKTLCEISRVLKIGGKAIITGKNSNYCLNDNLAYDAEVGARSKGHANNFTDMHDLDLVKFGLELFDMHTYKYRGDFSVAKRMDLKTISESSCFYEFVLFLTKTADVELTDIDSIKFSSKVSKAFQRIAVASK